MASYDFRKGMLSTMSKKVDNNLSDFEEGKYVFFNKNNLFTFGNGDGQMELDEDINNNNLEIYQLKLLLGEMQAIIYYMDTTLIKNMVYIGAAYGHHIYVLVKLFPSLIFHLYDDSNDWDDRLYELENVIINKHYFGEKDIKEWQESNEEIVLISDIGKTGMSDLLIQKEWIEQIKPVLSLLNFDFPQADKQNKLQSYLDGTLLRQIFASSGSSETRLLIKGIAYRDWDLVTYKKMNSYFDHYIRQKGLYFSPIDGSKRPIYKKKGLYNDFESTAFTIIVIDYLKKINSLVSETNILKILDFILDNCYANRKLNLIAERKMK